MGYGYGKLYGVNEMVNGTVPGSLEVYAAFRTT
jgi:hypothetical protein